MAKIKVEAKIRNAGEALDLLRGIGLELNRGKVSGKGWAIAEGEPEIPAAEIPNKARLDELTDTLLRVATTQDMTETECEAVELIQDISGNLLNELYTALKEAGYGTIDIYEVSVTEVEGQDSNGKGSDSSEKVENDSEAGSEENAQPGAPQEPTEGAEGQERSSGVKFPWQK